MKKISLLFFAILLSIPAAGLAAELRPALHAERTIQIDKRLPKLADSLERVFLAVSRVNPETFAYVKKRIEEVALRAEPDFEKQLVICRILDRTNALFFDELKSHLQETLAQHKSELSNPVDRFFARVRKNRLAAELEDPMRAESALRAIYLEIAQNVFFKEFSDAPGRSTGLFYRDFQSLFK